jgi:hypothetical protein
MKKDYSQSGWKAVLAALLALSFLGGSNLKAQTCPNQSSLQFPLWGDGAKWNLPGLYNSIQLADIDGDGQDELLGFGPFGIEVWHWQQTGQTWVKMGAGTPPFAATDTLMTGDVNGDGQAEIIQIASNTKTSDNPTVSVWRYLTAPQVWQSQPQLNLTLDISSNLDGALTPSIRFVNLTPGANSKTGKKTLVYLQTTASDARSQTFTPEAYQVAADGNGWVKLQGAPAFEIPILGGSGSAPLFDVGDVDYDGLTDIVMFEKSTFGFVVFAGIGGGSFHSGDYEVLEGTVPFTSTFALADVFGIGRSFVVVSPFAGNVTGYRYLPGHPWRPYFPLAGSTDVSSDASRYSTLQTVRTGLNSQNPGADTVLLLGPDGLTEYAPANSLNASVFKKVSNTPFISKARFGDDASHYTTIQTGHVNYGVGNTSQPIVIARDASGVHTLVRSTNVCQTGVAGFQLPQVKYFPTFTGGPALAYSYISNLLVKGNFDIRKVYSNNYASLPSYEATLIGLSYPAGKAGIKFAQADFDLVKAQLNAEFLAAGNVVAYFNASNFQLNNLFAGEEAALPGILTALALPTDQTVSTGDPAGEIFGNILLQVVSSFLFGLGSGPDAAAHLGVKTDSANAAAIAVSIIGTVVSDIESFQAFGSGSTSIGAQTLVVQNQVADWHAAAATGNALAQTRILQNWDLMRMLSQQIGDGTLAITSTEEDSAVKAGLLTFQIDTWRSLVPSVWSIYAVDGDTARPDIFRNYYPTLNGYPYLQFGVDQTFPICCGSPTYWAVWPDITANDSALGNSHPAVAQAAIEQLVNLGVDYHDILGRRNGWENIPTDDTGDRALSRFPDYFPIPVTPPVVPVKPVVGAPAALSILGGGQETDQVDSCDGFDPTPILTQSTPVNSVYPDPLTVYVEDANGNPVSGATVEIDGAGLRPTVVTILTDSDGFASTSLLANQALLSPYLATVKVISPKPDPTYPACAVKASYQLQTTPGLAGGPGGLQLTASLAAKSGTADNELLTVQVKDLSGSATGMVINNLTFNPKGQTSCSVVLKTPLPITMSGPDDKFRFATNVMVDASSCPTGSLSRFTMGVAATGTITLTSGVSYNVVGSNNASIFLP